MSMMDNITLHAAFSVAMMPFPHGPWELSSIRGANSCCHRIARLRESAPPPSWTTTTLIKSARNA